MEANEKLLERREKRTDYMAEYYQEHKAQKKEYSAEYYIKNKEAINARNKAWYENQKKKKTTKRNYYRQKDVMKILSDQRKKIGDTSYYLLVEELKKLDKEVLTV